MPEIFTFDEALADSAQYANEPHLLLGNGFSISCRPDCFTYGALLQEASFGSSHDQIREIFDLLGTTDFEHVVELLRTAAVIAEHYEQSSTFAARLRADAATVREALAVTLAARHPDVPYSMSESEYVHARSFLRHFRKIYTLNYDMLLYWTVMQDHGPPVPTNDGFRNGDDPDADYVVWEPYLDFTEQRLLFLHGGLHLYDSGAEVSKITWSRTGIPLVDQIRQALSVGRYPLIVTEGTSADKEAKILHNAYLNHGLRSFAKIQKTLFIHGHSLAPNDSHILRRIEEGKLDRVYVSVYGDPTSASNVEIIERGSVMAAERTLRRPSRPLTVHFYDAESAHVWR